MKILITGLSKSGTTALYHALKQSLPRYYTCLFEPRRHVAGGRSPFVLSKVLINVDVDAKIENFDRFHRKILLVRDPRDNLVSRLLYEIYDRKFLHDDGKVRLFLERLEQKRKTPSSISLLELFRVLGKLSDADLVERAVRRIQAGLRFEALHRGCFVYRYEHFVATRYASLEAYLGFALKFSGNVGAGHRRVARTKSAGDWRNWFTMQDVEYFGPILREYMNKYGYEDEWTLNPGAEILPEHSTEYVMRLVRERRGMPASA